MFISTKDIVAMNSNKVIFRGKLLFATDGNSLVVGHICFRNAQHSRTFYQFRFSYICNVEMHRVFDKPLLPDKKTDTVKNQIQHRQVPGKFYAKTQFGQPRASFSLSEIQ